MANAIDQHYWNLQEERYEQERIDKDPVRKAEEEAWGKAVYAGQECGWAMARLAHDGAPIDVSVTDDEQVTEEGIEFLRLYYPHLSELLDEAIEGKGTEMVYQLVANRMQSKLVELEAETVVREAA